MNFAARYEIYRKAAEGAIGKVLCRLPKEPPILAESMRYSLLAGGKRIRPVLFFSVLDAFGLPYAEEAELAAAIECIHTYSLIHDDLPALDNDALRRGKPSNHMVFGEANALLAGDALLSFAFELILSAAEKGERHLAAAQELAHAAGASGMVAGQSADLLYTKEEAGEEALEFIYDNKTARMIAAPLIMAARIAGADDGPYRTFGVLLGRLFQLTDDILDVTGGEALGKTVGKDSAACKPTAVRLFGLEEAQRRALLLKEYCMAQLSSLTGAEFLHGIVDLVAMRDH